MNRAGFTILLPLGYESYNDREKSPLESENVESNPNVDAIGVENDENGAMYEKHC